MAERTNLGLSVGSINAFPEGLPVLKSRQGLDVKLF
jgi:hypothetical protein